MKNFWFSPTQAADGLANVYDLISQDFSRTRQQTWGELEVLLDGTPRGSRVLDIGCGNGRLFPLLHQKQCEVAGIDISEGLRDIAQKRFCDADIRVGDFCHIPFGEGVFDEIWAVASFHHLPTQKQRIKALREMSRVLKKHGQIVMTVWNLWDQVRYKRQKRHARWRSIFLPWWDKRDFLIPWGQKKIPRYYHSFSVDNLYQLAQQSGFRVLECWGSHSGKKGDTQGSENICLRMEKSS